MDLTANLEILEKKKKSLTPVGIQTPDRPDCTLVTTLTNLTWVQEI